MSEPLLKVDQLRIVGGVHGLRERHSVRFFGRDRSIAADLVPPIGSAVALARRRPDAITEAFLGPLTASVTWRIGDVTDRPGMAEVAAGVTYAPAWALMLAFNGPDTLPYDGLFFDAPEFSWAARNACNCCRFRSIAASNSSWRCARSSNRSACRRSECA